MARNTKPSPSTKRGARRHSAVKTVKAESMQTVGQGDESSAQWARDAMQAWLVHARGLFDMAQTMQQAQVRALQDAANDFETAVDALEEAEDLAAVSSIPGRLFQAQWQHAMNNAWNATQRLVEIESAWLHQAQAQQAQRMEDLAIDAMLPPSAIPLPLAQVGGAAADAVAAQFPAEWRKWAEQWQQGIEQMSHRWNDAVKSVQPPTA